MTSQTPSNRAPRQFPVLLTTRQVELLIQLIKAEDQELSAAIDALNAPNVKAYAQLYRKLVRVQDDILEDSLEEAEQA